MIVGESKRFDYTGKTQTIDLIPGIYKLECYGSRGNDAVYGGKGGCSFGILTLRSYKTLYINVGGLPWNGGGTYSIYCGGGATDISLYGIKDSTKWNTKEHLYSRIIVAGGGGGRGGYTYYGGYGGGETGGNGAGSSYGGGGTQTSTGKIYDNSYGANYGGFGYGATPTSTNGEDVGCGGGGWYGGSCGGYHNNNGSGGGGSGYVYTESTAKYYPTGCLLDKRFYLTDTKIISNINNNTGYAIIKMIQDFSIERLNSNLYKDSYHQEYFDFNKLLEV